MGPQEEAKSSERSLEVGEGSRAGGTKCLGPEQAEKPLGTFWQLPYAKDRHSQQLMHTSPPLQGEEWVFEIFEIT